LRRCFDTAARFCRPLSGARGKPVLGVEDFFDAERQHNSYSVSKAEKEKTFRAIEPQRLALSKSDEPVDIRHFLEWPFDELFNDANLATFKLSAEEQRARSRKRPRAAVTMAEGHDVSELLLRLKEHNMITFYAESEAPEGPSNGAFAVAKSELKDRFILAAGPGNYAWSMERVQTAYERICAEDPVRAVREGLSAKVMDIPGPSALANLPPGVTSAYAGDKENYYYGFKQLPGLLGSQRFPAVPGHLVGMPHVAWVVPVMHVLAMGNLMAALLSQVAHRRVVKSLALGPLSLLRPRFQRATRQRALRVLAAAADSEGCVAVQEVPDSLWEDFETFAASAESPTHSETSARALLPDALRVPISAFAFQVLPVGETLDHLPKDASVALHTVLISTGEEVRFAKEQARRRGLRERRAQALVALSLYIDDEFGGVYEPGDVGSRFSFRDKEVPAFAFGNTSLLLSVLLGLRAGLRESWKKLRWASDRPGVALGVSFEFLHDKGRNMVTEVAPSRRKVTAEAFRVLANSTMPFVDEDVLETLLGNAVWEMLGRRPALSIFRVVYKALHSPNRPAGRVALTEALREEFLAASLLSPSFVGRTTEAFSTAAVFDASGESRVGNGGYGVALRRGLSPLVAAELSTVVGTEGGKLPHFREPERGVVPPDRLSDPEHVASARAASKFLEFDWEAKEASWTPAIHGEFKVAPRHVNIAEAVTGGITLERLCQEPGARGRRLYIGGDNTASLHCFRRGRSSTQDLNAVCRRNFCLSFFYDVTISWFWVPSASNPADGPSRWWYRALELRAAAMQARQDRAIQLRNEADADLRRDGVRKGEFGAPDLGLRWF
jgi:hypothetical protein